MRKRFNELLTNKRRRCYDVIPKPGREWILPDMNSDFRHTSSDVWRFRVQTREFDTCFLSRLSIFLAVKPFLAYFFVKFFVFIRACLYLLRYNT